MARPRKRVQIDQDLPLPHLPDLDQEKFDRLLDLARAVDIKPVTVEKYVKQVKELEYTAKSYKEELDRIRRIGITKKAKLPKDIVKHSWHDRLATDITMGRTIAVRGPAGNGKSTGVSNVLRGLGYSVFSLDCTDSTTVDMLVGGLQPVPDGKGGLSMEFEDGLFTKAFNNVLGAIQLDEFDALDPRVAMALQQALHRGSGKDPRRWVSSPDHPAGGMRSKGLCPIVVTMNTWGTGATREYVGRNSMDAASMDRFNTIIDTNYEEEAEILKAVIGLKGSHAQGVVDDAKAVRRVIEEKAMRVLCSTRRLLDIAEAMHSLHCDNVSAWEREFFSRLDKHDFEEMRKGLKKHGNHLGGKVTENGFL